MKYETSTPICFGIDYGIKKRCEQCPVTQECAEKWSDTTWNTMKKQGYGRWPISDTEGHWDDMIKAWEG